MANQIRVELLQVSASTSEATIRSHYIAVDRPVEKGGTDAGPMGGELFLAAVGGCFMSTLLAAIRARDATISGVRAEVVGALADNPSRFATIDLTVTAQGASQDALERLVAIADRGCIMMNTLRGTLDVRIHVTAAREGAQDK